MLIRRFAAKEIRVNAAFCLGVEALHRCTQGLRLDTQFLRQFVDRICCCQIGISKEGFQPAVAWAHHAEAIFLQSVCIANQIGRNGRRLLLLHRQGKQLVGGAFIDKALARLVHREHAGFGAVHDKVREHRLAAVGALADGHWRPEGVAGIALPKTRAELHGDIQRSASVTGRARAPLRVG